MNTNTYGILFVVIIAIILLSSLLLLGINIMSSTKKLSKQIVYEKTKDNGKNFEVVKRKTVFSGGNKQSQFCQGGNMKPTVNNLPSPDQYEIL